MEDPGVRLVKIPSCRLAYSTSASNFDLFDAEGRQIHFECGSGEIDTDVPQQQSLQPDASGKKLTELNSINATVQPV